MKYVKYSVIGVGSRGDLNAGGASCSYCHSIGM